MDIIGIAAEINEEGERTITVRAKLSANEAFEEGDVAAIVSAIEEASEAVGSRDTTDAEPEEKPKRRRAKAKPEEAEEPEEKPKRRRRSKADKEAEAAEVEAEVEAEEEKPKRRRRAKKEEPEFDGPSEADAATAASAAAAAFGPEFAGQILGDYSEDGTLGGIPEDKRQEFIDEVNAELDAPE